VAVSSSPTGPFTDARGNPLVDQARDTNVGDEPIDPMIFTDSDGSSYMYFGTRTPKVVRLGADMVSTSNELGCHNIYDYSDDAARAFRTWLRARYGTLDSLNSAWGTAFWSQHYSDWDHVLPPRQAAAHPNPTQQLDFKRFSSDALKDYLRAERDVLRAVTPDVPVTTNFMVMRGIKGMDYADWAHEVDFVSNDHWLNNGNGVKPFVDSGGFPATKADLESPAFKDEETPYFGGQKANHILTAAVGQVSTGWSYLPYQTYVNTIFGDTVGKSYEAGTALDTGLADWQKALVDYGNQQGFTVNTG
jgi:hypothetical protein